MWNNICNYSVQKNVIMGCRLGWVLAYYCRLHTELDKLLCCSYGLYVFACMLYALIILLLPPPTCLTCKALDWPEQKARKRWASWKNWPFPRSNNALGTSVTPSQSFALVSHNDDIPLPLNFTPSLPNRWPRNSIKCGLKILYHVVIVCELRLKLKHMGFLHDFIC